MSTSDDPTRPVSVAELLARNGTIGAPPPSGHRRRRRTGGVSVAELTGEIPVIRDDVPARDEFEDESAADETTADEIGDSGQTAVTVQYAPVSEADETRVVYEDYTEGDSTPVQYEQVQYEQVQYEQVQYEQVQYEQVQYEVEDAPAEYEQVQYEQVEYGQVEYTLAEYSETDYREGDRSETGYSDTAVHTDETVGPEQTVVETPEAAAFVEEIVEPLVPPKSSPPWARRGRGLERSHDPRPLRRSRPAQRPVSESVSPSGAEQMNYDPVDEAGSVAELAGQPGVEELRTYLQSSTGTLFSGETVADDLARRGATALVVRADGKQAAKNSSGPKAPRPAESRLTSARHAAVAVLQSILAVAFGGGLFIAFDQLWRWNNIVALVLSVLVILGLVVAVRVVRKTEDIVSTLIAVVVGALVTLGPLALLQST